MAKIVNKSFHCSSKEEKVVLKILIAKANPAVFDPTDKGIKAEEKILKQFKRNQEIH